MVLSLKHTPVRLLAARSRPTPRPARHVHGLLTQHRWRACFHSMRTHNHRNPRSTRMTLVSFTPAWPPMCHPSTTLVLPRGRIGTVVTWLWPASALWLPPVCRGSLARGTSRRIPCSPIRTSHTYSARIHTSLCLREGAVSRVWTRRNSRESTLRCIKSVWRGELVAC